MLGRHAVCVRCLYEVLRAHRLGLDFHLASHSGVLTAIQDKETAKAASAELKQDVLSLVQKLSSLDVETAEASQESDKDTILAAVHQTVGRPQLTMVLRGFLAEAALKLLRVGAFAFDTALHVMCYRLSREAQ